MNHPFGRALVLLVAASLVAGCTSGARRGRAGAGGGTASTAGPRSGGAGSPIYVEDREVGRLTPEDFQEFNRAWVLFVKKDPGWDAARDRWLARQGAAPYVLSENLLRYFWSATAFGTRADIDRIGESAKAAGEPAVAYFANFLVLDTWPLKEPATIRNEKGEERQVTVFQNDDVTRQHLAVVLSAIGKPAVARLSSDPFLHASSVSGRRYVMYTLGRIATDEAVDAVASMLVAPDWQDRGSAAKSLGFALPKNARAKDPLVKAKADADPFVRKKAAEALQGRTKSEF